FEHPSYVPLVQRAYELWADLEKLSGERLFIQTGGVMGGPEHGMLVEGSLLSARTHGLSHEMLSSSELTSRYPALRMPADWVALLEPRAGILFPEKCVAAFL